MVGQKSPALLAVFKKADKKGGDLRSVWGALKEEPCSWGNAQRQYRAWRAEQGVAPAAKTPAAKTPAAKPKPAGGAAASTAARTKAVQLYTGQGGCRVAARGQGCTAVHRPGWPAPHGTVLWYSV